MSNRRTGMSDPLTRPANSIDDELRETAPLFAPPLFEPSTQQLAHVRASGKFRERHALICNLLYEHGAMAIFQAAARLDLVESAISGRLVELVRLGMIEKTGERIKKPSTGSLCDVYRRTDKPLPVNER